jgi:hypothetical protein
MRQFCIYSTRHILTPHAPLLHPRHASRHQKQPSQAAEDTIFL